MLGVVALLSRALLGRWVWTMTRPPGSTEQLLPSSSGRWRAPAGRCATASRWRRSRTATDSTPEVAGYMRALRMSRYGGRATVPDRAQRRALRRELGLGLGPLGRLRALRALPPRLRSGRPPA